MRIFFFPLNENLDHTYFKVFFALFYYLNFILGKFLFRLLILLDLSQQYISSSAGSLLSVRWRVCRFHSHQVYLCLSSGLMAAFTRSPRVSKPERHVTSRTGSSSSGVLSHTVPPVQSLCHQLAWFSFWIWGSLSVLLSPHVGSLLYVLGIASSTTRFP